MQNSPLGIDIEQEDINNRLVGLIEWVQSDFNRDHANGRKSEELNATLRFIVGLFRLTNMRPWHYVKYIA